MKSIGIDFHNNRICIQFGAQRGVEENLELKKVAFNSFIPEQFRSRDSFTWDFEQETFAVNKDYDLPAGAIMTTDSFVPKQITTMPGLGDRFDEFIAIMGYDEVDMSEELPVLMHGICEILGAEQDL